MRTYTRPLIATLLALFAVVAIIRVPFGQWDAWATWNAMARLLYYDNAGDVYRYSAILHKEYPPLLYLVILNGFRVFGDTPLVPIAIAGAVYAGILWLVRKPFWILGVVGVVCLRYALQQYADLPLALAFLCAVVAYRQNKPLWVGVALGIGLLLKNEGALIAACFFATWTVTRVLIRHRKNDTLPLGSGGELTKPTKLIEVRDANALEKRPPRAMGTNGLHFPPAPTNLSKSSQLRGFLFTTIPWKALATFAPFATLLLLFKAVVNVPNDLTGSTGILERATDVSRYAVMLPLLLQGLVAFGGGVFLIAGAVLIINRQRVRWTVPLATIALVMLGYVGIYAITPYDIAHHIETSWDRLILHVFPAVIYSLTRHEDI